MRHPPLTARALLRATLPGDLRGKTILGDLLQEYEERTSRAGRLSMWLWYWAQALELGTRYTLLRIRDNRTFKRPSAGRVPDPAVITARNISREEAMEDLWTDLRYGIRMIFRTPTLSAISILTMGLGVGLVTFTFSVVYGAVLRPIPVRTPDRLIALHATELAEGNTRMWMPMHDFVALRDQSSSFEELAASYQGTVNIAGDEGPPARFDGAFMTANGLDILGVPPFLGRTFRRGEDQPGAERTIVLGYDIWRNYFAADESIIGTSVRANGEAMTVIGVMPPGFRFPWDQEIWVADTTPWQGEPRRNGQFYEGYGYLKESVTWEAAREDVQMIADRLAVEFPETNTGLGTSIIPYKDNYMPPAINNVLWAMLGATIGIMLIACANVANLLLARAVLRSRDVAIRTALGANRFRVIRQLLTETLVLGAVGGFVGLAIAYVSTDLFNAATNDIQKPYWIDMRMDPPTLIFTVFVTLVAAVAAGLLPALRSSSSQLGGVLNDESRGSSSMRLGRLSGILVVGELAVSCTLLIAAGFMVRSVINAQQMDVGIAKPASIMTARVGLFETEYPTRDDRQMFFRNLHARLNDAAEIESAALTSALPATGVNRWDFAVEGESYETDADYPRAASTQISAGYFDTMGAEFIAGRDFRVSESFWSAENTDDLEPLVIVNTSFVDRYLGESDPLGRRIRLGVSDSENPWMRIIGVVPDLFVGANSAGGIGSDDVPQERMYVTTGLLDVRFLSMAMRARSGPEAVATAARETVGSIDPNMPIYFVMPMTQVIADNSWAFTLFGSLFTIFGGAALFLASVGLYGVMSFSVTQRRREMGVRMALGAEGKDILRIVFRRVGVQLAIGLTIGVGLGYALSGPLRFVMFGVETTDLPVYVATVVTLLATGLLATYFPAHRATRVDPVTALRPD